MPTGADLARTLCEKFPDAPTKTLARRLYDENKEQFSGLEAARSAVRGVRGNCGKRGTGAGKSRTKATHLKPNGEAGWVPACPPSLAEPWEPYILPTPCRVLSLSDAHIPYHTPKAIEAAVEFAKREYDPTVLLLNGDWADFYAVSRHQKNPKMRSLKTELGVVEDSLSWLRGVFPKAQRIYKMGNHDERWDHFIWNRAPELWDMDQVRLENILHLDRWGYEMVGDQRPIMAGSLPIFHGHELGKSIFSPVNPARGAYLRTAHTVLIGHSHVPSTHAQPDLWQSETTCWSQGCLCDTRPEYARINKWAHGFAVVDVDKAGEFNLHNFKVTRDGKVRTV